jgi:hypothetical protein
MTGASGAKRTHAEVQGAGADADAGRGEPDFGQAWGVWVWCLLLQLGGWEMWERGLGASWLVGD